MNADNFCISTFWRCLKPGLRCFLFFANFPLFSLLLCSRLIPLCLIFSVVFFANVPFESAGYDCCYISTILDYIRYARTIHTYILRVSFHFCTTSHALCSKCFLKYLQLTKYMSTKFLQCQMKDLHKHWLLCICQMFRLPETVCSFCTNQIGDGTHILTAKIFTVFFAHTTHRRKLYGTIEYDQ